MEIDKCSICMDSLKEDIFTTECDHVFHGCCITLSCLVDKRCPLCRKTINIPTCEMCNKIILETPTVLVPQGKRFNLHTECIYSSSLKYLRIRDDAMYLAKMTDSIGMMMSHVYRDPVLDEHIVETFRSALLTLPKYTVNIQNTIMSDMVVKQKDVNRSSPPSASRVVLEM